MTEFTAASQASGSPADITFLPPLGPTGVETCPVNVAWVAGTAQAWDRDSSLGWELSEPLRAMGGSALEGRGNRHYSKGVRADDWRWVVLWGGQGGAAGTVYVEVRQSVWEGGAPLSLATWLLSRVRASRIDLAADLIGMRAARPSALFDRRESAWSRTERRGWELTLRGDGGEKLTVGARSSQRYLRVYVKGDDWIRHELEAKGNVARAIAGALQGGRSPRDVFGDEYGRIVRWH